MDYAKFSENLGTLIDSSKKTQEQIAHEMNITPVSLSRYTKGGRIPSLEYIVKIADYFNVSIDWLIGVEDDRYAYLPSEYAKVVKLYAAASVDDKRIIKSILSKYQEGNNDENG